MTESAAWYDKPLRDGEFDVTVKFRITGAGFAECVEKVRRIVETDMFERHIVPMYVPEQSQ